VGGGVLAVVGELGFGEVAAVVIAVSGGPKRRSTGRRTGPLTRIHIEIQGRPPDSDPGLDDSFFLVVVGLGPGGGEIVAEGIEDVVRKWAFGKVLSAERHGHVVRVQKE
jgi:hypothetical protein